MSDQAQGPGWWLASDGKWYPPDQAPAVPPPETWSTPPAGPPPSSGTSTGAKLAIAIVAGFAGLIVLAALALVFLGEETDRSFESTGTAIGGGDTDVDVPPPVVPPGYATIEGEGVSIAAPATWGEMAPEDVGMTAEELQAAFPDTPEELLDLGESFFEQGAVLVAFELGSEAAFTSNMNIIRSPGEAPLAFIEEQAVTDLTSIGANVLDERRVDLPVGEAFRVEYDLDVDGPAGDVTAHGVQFYVPVAGSTYVITVSTGSVDGVADTMIATFRVA